MQHLLCNVGVFRAPITDTEDSMTNFCWSWPRGTQSISCMCRKIQVTEKERSEVLWETALFGLIRVHSI